MPEQIYIGNYPKGQINIRLPFVIDNDSFPTMYNFYTWRGRAKRKRGTFLLGRLQIQVVSVAMPTYNWQDGPLVLSSGAGNLITAFSLPATSSIVPSSISFTVGSNTYTEPTTPDGTLVGSPSGTGTINYTTGAVTITGGGSSDLTGTFSYFPGDPVMGLRDYVSNTSSSLYPLTMAFDTTNAYQINQTGTPFFYNVSYYKGTNTPFVWSGADYQQFWTTNYSSALWGTNGKAGFNFVTGTYTSGSGTDAITFNFKSGGTNFTTLIVGDMLWFNEWTSGGSTINGLVGEVTTASGASSGNYVVTFTGNQTVSGSGIAQLLTSTVAGQDGIKWYDGDPTGGTGLPTGTGFGWVNFAPPLTAATVSIETMSTALYYLIGATAIVPFKDRLLFFGPTIQTSSGNPMYLQDVVIWSQNGTPYYNSLTPTSENYSTGAYYVDQTGLGGYISAGVSQPITTVSNNEDVLLIGFGGSRGRKTRLVFTGNDLNPFLFYNINSELPSDSTFSSVTLDKGAIDLGIYGICMTDQQSSQRIDLDIPDSVFQVQALNNGVQRVNAVRDYYKEWIYFSYPLNSSQWKFPTQSFLFNYRDNTWAIIYENYTTHGTYRQQTKNTWKSIGMKFKTWAQWREPWNSGSTSVLFPSVVAGNPQGYVVVKGQGTGESVSGVITAYTASGGGMQITSTNHCVAVGDYLYITGMLGATGINGLIGRVTSTADANTFVIDLPAPTGTYLGLGQFTRLSRPLLQTKQFNPYWGEGRKVRLLAQKYLMDYTADAQVTVNIYLSQDPDDAWNAGSIVPSTEPSPSNNSLIYSQLMYTCPESTNIGLTAANTNLQMPTAEDQFQIWHRFNTSLIGDSVQIGITLNDAQMRNLTYATSEITCHGIHLTVDRSQQLA